MVHYFKFPVLLSLLILIRKNNFTDLPRSETKLVVSDDNVKYSDIHSLFIIHSLFRRCPGKKFYTLKEAVAMIAEEEKITDIDIVVLPPSHIDDQSDTEQFEENELNSSELLPDDVAGEVELHYREDEQRDQEYGVTEESEELSEKVHADEIVEKKNKDSQQNLNL